MWYIESREVEKIGLGKVLEHQSVTAESLKEAAFAVMKDAHIRENLRRIQVEIARVPGNAGAVRIIEAHYKLKEHRL